MLAQDLLGLGIPGPVAARLANGGSGPTQTTATAGGAGGAALINAEQYVVFISAGTGGVILPSPITATGKEGPLIYDDYVIHNGIAPTVTVYPPVGVTMNIGGIAYTQGAPFALATLKTLTLYTGPTTTQWFGISA